MTDLPNHYTLLAGPPAADPFVQTINVQTTRELHDRGSLIEPWNCACATKTFLFQSLGLQGWIALGGFQRFRRLRVILRLKMRQSVLHVTASERPATLRNQWVLGHSEPVEPGEPTCSASTTAFGAVRMDWHGCHNTHRSGTDGGAHGGSAAILIAGASGSRPRCHAEGGSSTSAAS
jgi:hypothetical protein